MRAAPPLLLGYHCIDEVERRHDPTHLVVSPERFCSQVSRLQRRGYEFVTVSEFAGRLRASGPPAGVCALTFDDGSVDNARDLPQLLERLGVPATLFVCPGLLGELHPWLAPEAGVRLMTELELKQVATNAFIEIGSHTRTHADLESASADQALEEMASSKRDLEALLGREVSSFAYPFCRYSPACPEAAERAGYVCAVTCEGRGGWRPYELRREAVAAWDVGLTFELRTRGLYYTFLRSRPGRWALTRRQRGKQS